MKKRLISFLLVVVLVAAVFPVSAFAQPAVAMYTLGTNSTVAQICASHGVDYNTYKVLIMALNCVSNENELLNMPAGSVVVVPANANTAATLAGIGASGIISGNAGSAANTTGPSLSTNAKAGVATKAKAGDTIAYYLVSYTIQSGDTMIGLYNKRELNYKTYSSLITKLNKNVNFNKLRVGQTLLLPVPSVTAGDNVVYTVMRHVMQSGDTVYNVLRDGYGMDYKANTDLVKLMNSKDNIASFRVGEALLIAINGYVSPAALAAAAK